MTPCHPRALCLGWVVVAPLDIQTLGDFLVRVLTAVSFLINKYTDLVMENSGFPVL